MHNGVLQGSALSHTLSRWYIDDIPTHPQNELALYADNALVKAMERRQEMTARRVQEHIDILVDYYTKWRLKVNPTKSTITFITFRKEIMVEPVYYKDTPIPVTK